MNFFIKRDPDSGSGQISELEEKLALFATMVHLECRWKVVGELVLPEPEFPRNLGYHLNRFCLGVKECCCQEERCIQNDSRDMKYLVHKFPRGSLHRCHAGAYEVIIPIGEEGLEPIGLVMLGPFRMDGGHCCYPAMEANFQELPLVDPADVEAFLALVPGIFTTDVLNYYRDPTRSIKSFPTDERLVRIFDLLKSSPQMGVEDLARRINLSPSRLFHLFKKECQVSLGEFLLRYRLLVARRYLLSKRWSISQIAHYAGFTDQSHFTMHFRRRFGDTPAKYRKKMQARQ